MVLVPVNPDDVVVQELRAAGLRVTMPRQVVLAWLARHPHSTAAGVREKFGALSLQAIYGVVRVSTEAGLLRRIEPGNERGPRHRTLRRGRRRQAREAPLIAQARKISSTPRAS